jgi:CBS domain-containing protein
MMLVRDAMVPDPKVLAADATAQEAAALLARPEIRGVLVCEDGRLLGVVTELGLVQRIVAAGRNPRTTLVREIVQDDVLRVDADTPLEEAYRLMEEHDLDRLPVIEAGRLVGVAHRTALQQRLAWDDPPGDGDAAPGAGQQQV